MAKRNFVVRTGTSIGSANIDELSGNISTLGNVSVGTDLIVHGNLVANVSATVTGNLTVASQVFAGNMYQNGNRVLDETSTSTINVSRQDYSYTTPVIPLNGSHEFEIAGAVAMIVYRLTVTRPCRVEVFNSVDKTELNPYTFVATADHLTDDGSVLLSDGSVIQSRQYSIFANFDTPVQPKFYCRISNVDNTTDPVTLSLTYYVGVAGLFR